MSVRGYSKPDSKRTRSFLLVNAWPASDRALWRHAQREGSVFESCGRASEWRPRTLANVQEGYGQWLKWLTKNDHDALTQEPLLRVTRSRVKAYIESLDTLSPYSISMRLQRMGQMMVAMTDSKDFNWLFKAANRLKPVSVRNKRAKIRPSYELVELGLRLMAEAEVMRRRGNCPPEARYRSGLIIAMLAFYPLRRRNISSIIIGRHLIRTADRFRLLFEATETKQKREVSFDLHSSLVEPLEMYLAFHRPALIAGGRNRELAGNYLWISRDGGPLSPEGIADLVTRETKAAFGESINVNLFRDCAATTVAIDDPTLVHAIPAVLGHSDMKTSELYYNQATAIDAGRQYQKILDSRRQELRFICRKGGAT